MPPAARGALFEKTAPLDPPQKLLIKGSGKNHQEKKFSKKEDLPVFNISRIILSVTLPTPFNEHKLDFMFERGCLSWEIE